MNSSFGTTVARHRRPHFRHCLASGPLADQLCTSRFGEREISTPIYWGLLKQPDNQKLLSAAHQQTRRPAPPHPVLQPACPSRRKNRYRNLIKAEQHVGIVKRVVRIQQPAPGFTKVLLLTNFLFKHTAMLWVSS